MFFPLGQLFFVFLHLLQAVVVFLEPGVVLLFYGLQLRQRLIRLLLGDEPAVKALLNRAFSGIQHGLVAVQLGFRAVQLFLGGRKLLLARIYLPLAFLHLEAIIVLLVGKLLHPVPPSLPAGVVVRQALLIGLAALLQTPLSIDDLLAALLQLSFPVGDLPPGVLQLGGRLLKPAVAFRLALFILLPGVVQLFVGLGHHLVVPHHHLGFPQGLQRVRHRLDGILIGLGEGLLFLGLLHRHKSVGIYLQAETVLHGISDQIDLAVPDIAGFPLDGHVIGACDHAHHRKGIHGQGAAEVRVVGGKTDGIPDGNRIAAHDSFLHHAFPRLFWQAALYQLHPIQIGLLLPAEGEAVDTGQQGAVPLRNQQRIRRIGGHDVRDSRRVPDDGDVLLGQTHGGKHSDIHQVGFIVVPVGGYPHIRGGGQKSRKEPDTQRGNGENRQKPADALPDLPKNHLCVGFLHSYHSILSTGVGSVFSSEETTVPLLIWITRSAIAVSAWLWVITITVRPVFRQVSCSSFSTALPVL